MSKARSQSTTLLILIFLFIHPFCSCAQEYRNGAVSSAHKLATEAGISVLKNGGNAVDAAVAAGFVLAVVYPQAGNLGGGGFMVIHLNDGTNTSIDYREKAPGASHRNMYLDGEGNVIPGLSTVGQLAAGVPGSVAGMLFALERYGTMSREEILKFAIDIADTGFAVEEKLSQAIESYRSDFNIFEGSREIFGSGVLPGTLLVQKDLANTLRRISDLGKDGFYDGETAELIVEEMKRGNGIITRDDLRAYEPKEREVMKGSYKDYELISMGPPSSGGISLIYLLNILENYDLRSMGYGSAEAVQLMTEAMRRVYADRSEFMGDADFVNVPWDILTSKVYAERRMQDYSPNASSKSSDVMHGEAYYRESDQTTHYSVADGFGNVVSTTTTLNDVFGNRVVVKGAGFLLNNEMDDFSSKPGVPNIYGLVGNEANAIEPGKRMLSSMTPTIVFRKGKPFLVLGSPGGGRIITTVLQTFINITEFGMSLSSAIDSPRFHHQWLPDEIQFEKNYGNEEMRRHLDQMGYIIKDVGEFGKVDAIMIEEDGSVKAHTDRRGYGSAVVF
ncbi:MAG: gamma-glutamyltransferase [Ignavibacteria bacterium]|nr:gamma-glutamyltransferase [Ignavibacteria bacterium]